MSHQTKTICTIHETIGLITDKDHIGSKSEGNKTILLPDLCLPALLLYHQILPYCCALLIQTTHYIPRIYDPERTRIMSN